MSGGEKAAEQTKGFVKGIGDVSESLRHNINSFADDLIGSKSGTHSNAADGAHGTTTHGTTTDLGNSTHSSGFSADAKRAGEEVRRGVDSLGSNNNTTGTTTGHPATTGTHTGTTGVTGTHTGSTGNTGGI